jgi:S1-C subfamily serine protease
MQSFKRTLLPLIALLLLALAACSPATQASLGGEVATDEIAAEPTVEVASEPAPQESAPEQSLPAVQADGTVVSALEGTLSNIYETVNPSVVHIEVLAEADGQALPEIPDFQMPDPQPRGGEGSGFVWDKEGHIVTNNHVIAGATQITVVFADGLRVPAEIVGTDPDSDLAVIKVDVPADQLRPVTVADSTEVRVGELVIAIGNPFGQEGTMTVGIVSALGRLLRVDPQTLGGPGYSIPDIIQTDAAINPGNSGGVLLDDQGAVVGVTTAIISPARANSGVGFAVPSVIVDKVVPVLIRDGQFEHPYLGVSGSTLLPEMAEAMDLPADQRGALIAEVVPGGPAAEAGLQGSTDQVEIGGAQASVGGDVVVAANGQQVQSMDDLITILARYGEVGEPFPLTIIRDGEEMTVTVTLSARPDEGTIAQRDQGETAARGGWMGIIGGTLTPEIAEAMDLPAAQTGVLVDQVQTQGPAAEAGLRGSDTPATINGQEILVGGDVIVAVDGQSVEDIQMLQQLLAERQPGDEIDVTILRDGAERTLSLTLGERPTG